MSNISKKLILFISDLIIILFSLSASYSLRLEKIYLIWEIDYRVILIYLIIFFFIFYIRNIYRILLRYFDYYSIIQILKSIIVISAILIPINFILYKDIYFPRSISFIAPIIFGILIIFHRIAINFIIKSKKEKEKISNNILIYGINDNTVSLLRSLRQYPNYGLVRAFIDVYGKYKRRELSGVDIFKKEELLKIIDQKDISEIIIGTNNFTKKKLNKYYQEFEKKNIRVRNISEIKNFLKNIIKKSLETKINFFDIIDRPKIEVDKRILKKQIESKIILVTGGGGSIGSELCLQIIKQKPKKLLILDNSEINLFNIKEKVESIGHANKKNIKFILGDCTDLNFLKEKFKKDLIDDIYHAAAYKHVNFGENNIYSIIKNNIIGTKHLLDFSEIKKIKNFTFISTDKAVRPQSILGYTKKIREMLVSVYYKKNNLSKKNKSNFTIVRFGNVIGSSGSVIPIFLDQIKKKQPLTVTHKDVKRYFMSISEAVQLVINSANLNKKGLKIYVLDMGEQIKIYDIAKRIIQLSGNTLKSKTNPRGSYTIKFVGLKKGEKMSEEFVLGQNLIKTKNDKIFLCNENLKKVNLKLNNSKFELDIQKFDIKKLKKLAV
ncbi:MAG: hypothetical protein CMN00_06180 [Rickettsiales bacterium]|nr:hypothetical protein [Rickettsiales bacterium]